MSRLSPANQQKLRKAITKFGVPQFEPWILRHATECVLLRFEKPDPYKMKGNTRLGGVPDLPDSMKWPCRPDGKLLNFVLQIDLSQLPKTHARELPDSGRIYVFVGDDEDSENVEHVLVYDNSPVDTLVRAKEPQEHELASEHLIGLKPQAATTELAISLPVVVWSEQWRDPDLDVNNESWDDYSEMQQSLYSSNGEPPSQLLGYPSLLGEDPARTAFYSKAGRKNVERKTLAEIEASLKEWEAHGNPSVIAACKKEKDDHAWYTTHRDEVEAGVKEWRMLAQIQSNVNAGLFWWDAGDVQVMIRDRDLELRQFHETHTCLFSS